MQQYSANAHCSEEVILKVDLIILHLHIVVGHTLPGQVKSYHLVSTKQIGTILPLDNYLRDYYVSAGDKLLTLTGAVSSFLFLKQSCGRTFPVVVEKM